MCTSTGNFDSIFFLEVTPFLNLETFIYKSIPPNNDFGNLNMVDLVVTNTFPPTYKPIVSLFTCAIDADLGSCSLTASVCVVESTLSYSYTVVEVTDLTGVEVDGGSEMDTSGVNKAVLWPSSGSSSESLSVSPKSLLKDFRRAAGVSGGVLSSVFAELTVLEAGIFFKGKEKDMSTLPWMVWHMAHVSFTGGGCLEERTAVLGTTCLFVFFMGWDSVS